MERMEVTETFAGIALPGHLHTQESLRFAAAFAFRPTDVLIATYPKSGTTWMQEILTLMFSLGDARPAKTIPNWERAPWLEQIYCREALRDTETPRLLTTHMPAHVLAPALQRSKAKVIYVARNPKDVAVSFYHFHHLAKFLPDPGSFDAFLTQFLEGTGLAGPAAPPGHPLCHLRGAAPGPVWHSAAPQHLPGVPAGPRNADSPGAALQLCRHAGQRHGQLLPHPPRDHGPQPGPLHAQRCGRGLARPLLPPAKCPL
ncbi:bile salt sulfotransferase-like isoform X2 [Neopelma chrysocephalum]|uniref:bile salt sulfotransferase-like isoform X2 n=1 Tax=Neopelma chrysocephalum TaxID=114329 RepID=UPI000FCD077B|nr:bile salt sulfotransferase-like isoform X2 [Neopelma chrysocephalum]